MTKKFTLENMNGDTQDEKKSCSLDDMNCLDESEKKESLSLENTNGDTQDDKKSCSLKDMNCIDEEKK